MDYLGARALGRSDTGSCGAAYSCPASLASVADLLGRMDLQQVTGLISAVSGIKIP